jgi:hypothetical protein
MPFPRPNALAKQHLSPPSSSGEGTSNKPSPSPLNSDSNTPVNHVPGAPGIDLSQDSVCKFLSSELNTPLLDELYNDLWLVARKSGQSIEPLNRQRVKAREIVATEDAYLHLVWQHNIIYVKPMPLCLLNYDFWKIYLPLPIENTGSDESISTSQQHLSTPMFDRRVALGFMRSYALLVRHHLDFMLARESHLFPLKLEWEEWSEFIAHFRHIEDEEVANRYHYGQLRLTRLNWAVRLFRPSSARRKLYYELPYWSIGMYVEQAVAPLLFLFASLSLVLSSMQVLLSVPEEGLNLNRVDASSLAVMRRVFWVFSVMVLLLLGLVWVLLFVIPSGGLIRQLAWGFKNRGKTNTGGLVQRKQEATTKV